MESPETSPTPQEDKFSNLKKVTPVSKYLALVLFVVLPFIGGWIGYNYAPEKVVEVEVEVERVVVKEVEKIVENDSGLELDQSKFAELVVKKESAIEKHQRYYVSKDGIKYFMPKEAMTEYGLFYLYKAENKVFYLRSDTELSYPRVQLVEVEGVYAEDLLVLDDFENYITKHYAKDNDRVYFLGDDLVGIGPFNYILHIIEGADVETFEIKFPSKHISIDVNNVYHRYSVIEYADPSSFGLSNNTSINYDKNNVYLWLRVLLNADPETYEVLHDFSTAGPSVVLGQDKDNYYIDYCSIPKTEVITTPQSYEEYRTFVIDNTNISPNDNFFMTGGFYTQEKDGGECVVKQLDNLRKR